MALEALVGVGGGGRATVAAGEGMAATVVALVAAVVALEATAMARVAWAAGGCVAAGLVGRAAGRWVEMEDAEATDRLAALVEREKYRRQLQTTQDVGVEEDIAAAEEHSVH